jgi:menaquinol-cytochrome c reductase cytochrome b/c subunit
MTEIPEHLLKRAKPLATRRPPRPRLPRRGGRRQRLPLAAIRASPRTCSSVPSRQGQGAAVAAAAATAAPAVQPRVAGGAVATAGPPIGAGPGGHTQRLLTVVKSGSIQDVKAKPSGQGAHVAAPAHRRVRGRAGAAPRSHRLLVFVNAPLQELANFNQTPNPSKAPWYFLGLQELLTMFHPMVAGVTIPGMGIFC